MPTKEKERILKYDDLCEGILQLCSIYYMNAIHKGSQCNMVINSYGNQKQNKSFPLITLLGYYCCRHLIKCYKDVLLFNKRSYIYNYFRL